jgi:hypothetical protein
MCRKWRNKLSSTQHVICMLLVFWVLLVVPQCILNYPNQTIVQLLKYSTLALAPCTHFVSISHSFLCSGLQQHLHLDITIVTFQLRNSMNLTATSIIDCGQKCWHIQNTNGLCNSFREANNLHSLITCKSEIFCPEFI